MAEKKSILLRLDPELADQLQAVAAVEERPVSELIREAIGALVEERRRDAAFQRRLRDSARRQDEVLRSLRAADDG